MARSLRTVVGIGLVVAIAVTGALSGCANIPTSGVPTRVDDVDTNTTGGYIITPEGPKDGASAEDIVRGFIDAGTGFSNDYAIAREYLAPGFSSTWDPTASVLVYDGAPTVALGTDNSATVTVSVGASIDKDGHYTEMPSNADIKQNFTLVQQSGQWRILSAPDGISIIRPRFSLIYTQQALYFYDPNYAYRVPDVRWIANTPWSATRLVQLLLKGPSSWLAKGVVATAFPDGTKLAIDTISTASSVTTVELSAQALSADEKGRQLMLLQLQSTLSGLSSVTKVQISVNGTVVPIGDLGSAAPVSNPAPQVQRLIVDSGGQLSYLSDNGSTEQVGGLAATISQLPLNSFSIRGSVAAASTAEGVWIATSGSQKASEVVKGAASDITVDPGDFVWSVVDGRVRVFAASGTEVSLAAAWLGGTVISAKLSRDGTRLAMLVRDGVRTSLLVSGLIRDADGKPTELAQPLTLTSLDNFASSVVWYSDQAVSLLSTTGSTSTVTLMTVGGESTKKTSTTTTAAAMTAGSGEESIRLLLTDGAVVAPRGSNWLQVAAGVAAIGTVW